MSEYFPKPKSFGGKVKAELDLSNYPKKADSKNATGVDTSDFAKRTDLANLKSDVDKLGIDKLKNLPSNFSNLKSKVHKLDVDKLVSVPIDLSKLSDAVKNDVVKKDVYNAKIKTIEDKTPDFTNFATNTTLNAKTNGVKGEIPTALNAKINDVKVKISNITNLATAAALTVVENNIPNISNLVKKLTITQKLVKLKIKLLQITIMINILLPKDLIS